ncbi:hypothetical protein AXFE_01620 [Acidithrix ferrooxidans]|jgi:hypothetical protein|uniref:Uncharacterized protein n=1 Tax=Acidithrix ferrooxidans TaxID=1280514 RepID=A0A0D8HM18_9ACTN|nr:hypothetical protein AXFE_01620 [Acidithrix ferrooxidans]
MKLAFAALVPIIASLVNLSTPGHFISVGVISISVANFIVILLMIAVFLLAIFVPFPGKKHQS